MRFNNSHKLKNSHPDVHPSSKSTSVSNAYAASGPALRDFSSSRLPTLQPTPRVVSETDARPSDNAGYRCSSCGDPMSTNLLDMCALCRLDELSPKHVPRKDPRPALVPATNAVNATTSSSVPSAPQPKPRQRMTKKMRQREFENWFSNWTKGYHKYPELRAVTTDKTDYWRDEQTRQEGGTVYFTMDEFFSALQRAWVDQQVAKARGGKQVVEFYGAYSIVAQPRINAHTRHEKIRERMRLMGFR